jgi:hypothetical protein
MFRAWLAFMTETRLDHERACPPRRTAASKPFWILVLGLVETPVLGRALVGFTRNWAESLPFLRQEPNG